MARAEQACATWSIDVARSHLVWALLAVALGALAAGALRRAVRRWRARRRSARAYAIEGRAAALLERWGYRVVGRQVAARYVLHLDGAPEEVNVRADYIVEAGSARYVAEVKSGRVAPRLDTAATRRQLLEYRLAFDVDGVLLVDGEASRVHAVEFPLPRDRAAPRSRASSIALGVLLGAAAVLAAARAGLLP